MDYRAFGDVIVFDGIYKTNKYTLPLVPFVAVNHHKSTVLSACGIVAHEDTRSYVWLLRSFSDAMSQKHLVFCDHTETLLCKKQSVLCG
jgi:zinc finger SWIM domain-containing protein 3